MTQLRLHHRRAPLVVAAIASALAFSILQPASYAVTFQTVDQPGATMTSLWGISGTRILGMGQGYFTYEGGAFTALDLPYPDKGGEGWMGLNGIDGNRFVGWWGNFYLPWRRGYFFDGSGYSLLSFPGSFSTEAYGISGNSIVGQYTMSDGSQHGFLYNYSTGVYTAIDVPGALATGAEGVSGNLVVGSYTSQDGRGHGFLWDGATCSTLDFPGVDSSTLSGISGSMIVGNYWKAPNWSRGFLYDGSGYTTIDDPLAVYGTYVTGVHGNTVVGYYRDAAQVNHGFIATVPEPSTLALLCVAAGLGLSHSIGYRRRHARPPRV
jgi:hypothetical protein